MVFLVILAMWYKLKRRSCLDTVDLNVLVFRFAPMGCLNAGVDVIWVSVRKRGIAIYTSRVSVRPSWRH